MAALIGCAAPVEPAPAVEWTEDAGHLPVADSGGAAHGVASPAPAPDEWPRWLPSPEQAMDAWPADMLTERCQREAPHIELFVGTGAEVDGWCWDVPDAGEQRAQGCYRSGPARIAVSTDRPLPPEHVAAHELAHWLHACSGLGTSNDDHGKPLFEASISGALDVWRSEVAELDPVPAEAGACPSSTVCEQGLCRNRPGSAFLGLSTPPAGDSCAPLVYGGRSWQPELIDGLCAVTC